MSEKMLIMLATIKNGYLSKLDKVCVPYSENNLKILMLLYKDGFINGYYFNNTSIGRKDIVVVLKYYRNIYLFNYKILSKPGRLISCTLTFLYKKYHAHKFVMLSTTQGFVWLKDAFRLGLGGTALFVLYLR